MKKKLVALKMTVTLGKVTVLQDYNPRSGCVAIAEFGESKQYGVGSTCSEALDDFIRRHGIQVHEIEADGNFEEMKNQRRSRTRH